MLRKTKIICTIGPASENEETLTAMCEAGMNVARLNFSHGSHEEHLRRINLIRSVREKLNLPIYNNRGAPPSTPQLKVRVISDYNFEE